MKRAGPLDTRVAIQRKGETVSESGDLVEAWSTLVERWAALRPLTGTEVNASDQWIAREQTEFMLRWSIEIADLSPLDRIVCPASDATSSPEVPRSLYDIILVHEVGRNEDLRVVAARRVA